MISSLTQDSVRRVGLAGGGILLLVLTTFLPSQAEECLDCHANPQAEGSPPQIRAESLAQSVHREVACLDCHPEARKTPHIPPPLARLKRAGQCGSCHQEIYAEYFRSVHGMAVGQGSEEAPICSSCHVEHSVSLLPQEPSLRSAHSAVRPCATCHEDPVITERAALLDDVVQTYRASYHGLARQCGSQGAARCESCHGTHAILPSSDPRSSLHPRNLVQTCGQCHAEVTEDMIRRVHTPAGPGAELDWWSRLRIFYPIANRSINPLLIMGLGVVVGMISGIFGVGGGFLLTPLLIFIGIPPAVAAATDSAQIVAGGSSGTAGHYRAGNVDLKMGLLILAGGLLGGTDGVYLVRWLRNLGSFNHLVKLVYVIVLTFIGLSMLIEGWLSMRAGKKSLETGEVEVGWLQKKFPRMPCQMDFPRSGIHASALLPLTAGFIVGNLAAFLGSGGGFIMLPTMIFLIGMPTRVAIGTNLFQVTLTCVNVAIEQAFLNHTVDVLLAVTLFSGSVLGAQVGVRLSQLMRGDQLRALLGLIVLGVMGALLYTLMATPENLIALAKQAGGNH